MLKIEIGSLILINYIINLFPFSYSLRSKPPGWPFCFFSPLPFPFSHLLCRRPPRWTLTRMQARSSPPGWQFCFLSYIFFKICSTAFRRTLQCHNYKLRKALWLYWVLWKLQCLIRYSSSNFHNFF